jgi:glycosyltransferase involved in cell wall biosynthesis
MTTGDSHCICLIHPIDPRGDKIGGIETHVRLILGHAPSNWRVLMVGVDGRGDCELGRVINVEFGSRHINFLPIIYYPDADVHEAAKALQKSITVRFTLGLLKHLFSIRRAIGSTPTSVELERYEFSFIPFLLGVPVMQVIHGEGSKEDKMDSLIKKYWFLHRTSEEIAIRLASEIVCVNPNIYLNVKRKLSGSKKHVVFMPVSVDTDVFRPQNFDVGDEIFRVVFAGRLDEFKDPPTMFRAFREIHDRLGGRFEFHYVGTSDPNRYPEFEEVAPFTIRHGFKRAHEVSEIIAHCHAGVLTSFFEGMPCYLLEVLSVGRPVVAIRLPQYDLVMEEGVSGMMIERMLDDAATIEKLAQRFADVWSAIQGGRMKPELIRSKADQFSVKAQLGDHFSRHQRLIKAGIRVLSGNDIPNHLTDNNR